MKRLSRVTFILLFAIMLAIPTLNVWAYDGYFAGEQILVSEIVEYYKDGSILVTSVYELTVPARSSLYNKAGRKTYEYRDVDGNILWTFAVQGEFRIIEGASVSCVSASCSSQVLHENWSCTRKSASPSGSQAVANGVFEMTVLGIAISTQEVSVTLSCDHYGNLY